MGAILCEHAGSIPDGCRCKAACVCKRAQCRDTTRERAFARRLRDRAREYRVVADEYADYWAGSLTEADARSVGALAGTLGRLEGTAMALEEVAALLDDGSRPLEVERLREVMRGG